MRQRYLRAVTLAFQLSTCAEMNSVMIRAMAGD
jgi:hypothetical protein